MANPLCTVMIATHNRKSTLMRCLDLIEDQDVGAERLQVVVVDDGSTDGTGEVLAERANRSGFGDLVLLSQANQGPSAARALGLPSATAAFTLFVNDDTMLAPWAIGAHLDTHRRHPRSMVLGSFDFVPEVASDPLVRMLGETTHLFSFPLVEDGDVLRADLAATCNLSVPTKAAKDVGFDPRFTFNAEDVDFALRMQTRGYTLRFRKAATGWHDHRLDVASIRRSSVARGTGAARLAQKHGTVGAIAEMVHRCILAEVSYEHAHEEAAATLEAELERLPDRRAPIPVAAYEALARVYRLGNTLGCAREPSLRSLITAAGPRDWDHSCS